MLSQSSGVTDKLTAKRANHRDWGLVSRRMLERYSHVRMEAKRTAMEAPAVSTKTAGYDTTHDTNAAPVRTRAV
jgi:hypothetical protein